MDTVESIFAALDGPSKLARGINIPVQTAYSWKANRAIPKWRRPAILQFAIDKGKGLSPEALQYLGAKITDAAGEAAAAEAR